VGIGTTTPSSRLVVQTAGQSDPSLTHNAAGIAQFSSGLTQLALTASSTSPFGISLQGRHATLDGYSYPINLNPLGGNVGIGNTKSVIYSGCYRRYSCNK